MQDFQKTFELILDYLKGVWVKKRYVMLCSWLICPIGFIYVASLPDIYNSNARVFVDTRSVLQPLLRGLTIQTDPQEQITMMVRTLLSRPNIEKIARESDLDISVTTPSQYEKLINQLKDDIKLIPLGRGRDKYRDNLYSISYTSNNPEMAKRVVLETINIFIEGALGSSRKDSDSANQFIEQQIAEYETRLTAAEQRRADFKRKYAVVLPNQGSFQSKYSGLESSLAEIKLLIKENQQQVEALKKQIGARKKGIDDFSVRPANAPSSLATRYDSRIKTLEESLDSLMLKYTDLHPDVIEANSLLTSLKELRQKEINEYLNSEDGGKDGSYQIGSFSSELNLEISRLEGQIASLKVREADFEAKIKVLKDKIDLVPQIEAELIALDRDYSITKSKYEQLLSRRESADLSQKADVSAENVQFKVIDPPIAATTPSGPNRLIGYSIVIVLGFGTGLALAFLISQLSPVVYRGTQLTSMTTYPVFGVVSHLNKDGIKKINKKRLFIFLCSSGLIVMLYGAFVGAELLQINVLARVMS